MLSKFISTEKEKAMKYLMMIAVALVYFLPARAHAESTTDQISAVHRMESNTLERLYKEKPDTRREIRNSVGYAVFSSGELAVLWVSAGYGHGVAHSNHESKDTYMKMATIGGGIGLGAKDYNTVFVFHDASAFNSFITTGLDLSGTADMAAKAGSNGGAASGGADVLARTNVYQMTDSGLLAQAMIQGTKYWRDDTLNNARLSEAQ
jgi:lipid-binding SYLF domain-containing protein